MLPRCHPNSLLHQRRQAPRTLAAVHVALLMHLLALQRHAETSEQLCGQLRDFRTAHAYLLTSTPGAPADCAGAGRDSSSSSSFSLTILILYLACACKAASPHASSWSAACTCTSCARELWATCRTCCADHACSMQPLKPNHCAPGTLAAPFPAACLPPAAA